MQPVKIDSVSPILTVHDLSQAMAFYQRVLGFDLAWSWGAPAEIAAVCRDNVEITLTQRVDAKPAGSSHIYLNTSGIDAYYAQIEQAGAPILVPIGDRPYGMRDFRIADPSGNELSIGQPVAGDGKAV
jgi:predicted enzyme related to lactoylglutathione lyase